MGKLLRSKKNKPNIRFSYSSPSFITRQSKLLSSKKSILSSRVEFAIPAGTSALGTRPGRGTRILNRISYHARVKLGSLGRAMGRRFGSIRSRVPSGIKTRLRNIGTRINNAFS